MAQTLEPTVVITQLLLPLVMVHPGAAPQIETIVVDALPYTPPGLKLKKRSWVV
jgi:hypothetical protein